jgi:hypothetical protein
LSTNFYMEVPPKAPPAPPRASSALQARLHGALGSEPMDAAALSGMVGATLADTTRALQALETHGLAVRDGRRWKRVRGSSVTPVVVEDATGGDIPSGQPGGAAAPCDITTAEPASADQAEEETAGSTTKRVEAPAGYSGVESSISVVPEGTVDGERASSVDPGAPAGRELEQHLTQRDAVRAMVHGEPGITSAEMGRRIGIPAKAAGGVARALGFRRELRYSTEGRSRGVTTHAHWFPADEVVAADAPTRELELQAEVDRLRAEIETEREALAERGRNANEAWGQVRTLTAQLAAVEAGRADAVRELAEVRERVSELRVVTEADLVRWLRADPDRAVRVIGAAKVAGPWEEDEDGARRPAWGTSIADTYERIQVAEDAPPEHEWTAIDESGKTRTAERARRMADLSLMDTGWVLAGGTDVPR